MNDRLRFRTWNTISCGYVHEIQQCSLFDYFIDNDKYVIEQCTGLKDKNGRLIYEGDIVSMPIYAPEDDGVLIGYVKYNCEEWKYNIMCPKPHCLCMLDGDLEIIGNIHENPELLGGK